MNSLFGPSLNTSFICPECSEVFLARRFAYCSLDYCCLTVHVSCINFDHLSSISYLNTHLLLSKTSATFVLFDSYHQRARTLPNTITVSTLLHTLYHHSYHHCNTVVYTLSSLYQPSISVSLSLYHSITTELTRLHQHRPAPNSQCPQFPSTGEEILLSGVKMTDVIRLRPHPGRIGDGESIAMMGPCPGHASVGRSASTRWSTRRGMVMLAAMSTVTMLRGVSATFDMEAPRELCIQAIQTAIVTRTQDLFQEMYLPNGHQVCFLFGTFSLCQFSEWEPQGGNLHTPGDLNPIQFFFQNVNLPSKRQVCFRVGIIPCANSRSIRSTPASIWVA